MNFEIDNTPEHVRRSRRTENARKQAPKEECPRLISAPFSRPPQVVFFDNAVIGTPCERNLEVLDPLKCIQKNIKGKSKQIGFRVSPGKKEKKPLKRSLGGIQKKKSKAIINSVKRVAQMVHPSQYKKLKSYNKENIPGVDEYTTDSQQPMCHFDSFISVDIHFNSSEIVLNMKKEVSIPSNALKPSNRQLSPGGDIFDNVNFTPLKTLRQSEKLEHGSQRVLSMHLDCEDDSLDSKENDGPHAKVSSDTIAKDSLTAQDFPVFFSSLNRKLSQRERQIQYAQTKTRPTIIPRLQSIPVESQNHNAETQILDKTDKEMTTMDYEKLRKSTIIVQQKYKALIEMRKERAAYLKLKSAAIVIQTRYRAISAMKSEKYRYKSILASIICIQRFYRGKLLTRKIHAEFLQKRTIVTKLQAIIRGYLVRKEVALKRENLLRIREKNRQHWAACKIQALFLGHLVRAKSAMHDSRVVALRRRWRDYGLRSTKNTLEERYDQVMESLSLDKPRTTTEFIIRDFRSLELLTEVYPMMFNETAPMVVRHVYSCMSTMNRSISSVDLLKSAATVLANLARYCATGPKIYTREHILPLLRYMWRFSTSDVQLFLILSTYLWLFAKYDAIREDLTEYLHTPENHKIMLKIKNNISRVMRMNHNVTKHKPVTSVRHGRSAASFSHGSGNSILMPALQPDYGIARVHERRYFVDTQQAIMCLFRTYKL